MRRLARPLMYLGIAVVVLGLAKLHASQVAVPPYDLTGTSRFAWAGAYVLVLSLVAYGVGLPDLTRTSRTAWAASVAAPFGGAMVVSLVQLVAGDALLPRFVVFGSALLLVPWFVVCSAVSSGVRHRAETRDRVLLVGATHEAEGLREDLARRAERPAVLCGVIEVAEARPGGVLDRPLVDAVDRYRATVVVLALEAQEIEAVVSQAATLHRGGVRVRTLSLFSEEWLGKLPLSELERVSMMFDIGEIHRLRYGRVKRLVDILLAGLGLTVLALAVPFVLLGDVIANRGALFYTQPRIGKDGASFGIRKFRTMVPSGGVPSNEWTTEDDPRITPFGGFLRRTHLDELPQVINVLRGELSVVGPRPEQPHYVAELTEKLPFYDLRHLVRPGVTGWAQVKYGYAGDERDALEKLQYDFYYLRRQRMGLDVRIIGRTVRSVFAREGR